MRKLLATAFALALLGAPVHAQNAGSTSSTTIMQLPLAGPLTGAEILPLDQITGQAVVPQTKQATLNALSIFLYAHLPPASTGTPGGVLSSSAPTHQFATGISTSGVVGYGQPAFGDISGILTGAQIPPPTTSAFGGILSSSAPFHQYVSGVGTSGALVFAQPAAADVTGLAPSATTDTTNGANISSGTFPAARMPAFSGDIACPVNNPSACVVNLIGGKAVAAIATTPTAPNLSNTAPFTGAATLTQQAVDGLTVDVRKFTGADPTGTTDSTAAFANAITALGSAGGTVTYCGQFKVSAIPVTTSNVFLRGCSYGGATLLQTTASGDTVRFGSGTTCCTVQNVGIEHTTIQPAPGVTRTGGSAVKCAFTFRCSVSDVDTENQFSGIELYGAELSKVDHNYVHQGLACPTNVPVPSSFTSSNYTVGIWDHGNAGNSVGNEIRANFVSSANNMCFGIYLGGGVQGETVAYNGVQNAYVNGILTNVPGNGDAAQPVTQNFFDHNQWDITASAKGSGSCPGGESANSTFVIRSDAAGAPISEINFDDEWLASSLCAPGLFVVSNGSPISLLNWNKLRVLNNYTHGVELLPQGSTLSNLTMTSPTVIGNSTAGVGTYHGIDIEPGVQHVNITGGASHLGNTGYGIVLQAGATDYISAFGVDVTSNQTGGILDLSTGTHNQFSNDPGFNPVGYRTQAVTASPMTFTTPAYETTVFIVGGTCSLITMNGNGMTGSCPATFTAPPNTAIGITYSAAPAGINLYGN